MALGKVRLSGFPSVWAASGYREDIDAPTAVWHPCARNVCLLKNTGVLDTRRAHNKVRRTVWKLHARSCFLDVSSVAESEPPMTTAATTGLRFGIEFVGFIV